MSESNLGDRSGPPLTSVPGAVSGGSNSSADRPKLVLTSAEQYGCAGLIVCGLANIRYLTGFTGSAGAVVLASGHRPILVTDGRYTDQAKKESPDCEVLISSNPLGSAFARAAEVAGTSGISKRVGFEAEHLSVASWLDLTERALGPEWVETRGLVEEVRRQKDAMELQSIESACSVAEKALGEVLPLAKPGLTEREFQRALDDAMFGGGAHGPAFPTIVASGPNSAIPHHTPTDRALESGDLLKIDFGARVDGYCSDITRTFVVDAEPTAEQIAWHKSVIRASDAARALLRPGVQTAEVFAAARDSLVEDGLAGAFTHGLGHGVGLDIHEAPIISAGNDATLGINEVVTIEPGVYFPGVGGIRVEDTLAVTEDGYRSLSSLPRGLQSL